jgi:hypothetical protein
MKVTGRRPVTAYRKAHEEGLNPRKSAPLDPERLKQLMDSLKGIKPAWHLLVLSWHVAGRVGDVRQLRAPQVTFDFRAPVARQPLMRVQFTRGKGAHFRGPYTVTVRLPKSQAKQLQEYVRKHHDGNDLFSMKTRRITPFTHRR